MMYLCFLYNDIGTGQMKTFALFSDFLLLIAFLILIGSVIMKTSYIRQVFPVSPKVAFTLCCLMLFSSFSLIVLISMPMPMTMTARLNFIAICTLGRDLIVVLVIGLFVGRVLVLYQSRQY